MDGAADNSSGERLRSGRGLHKNRGCRSKFGVPPSITPRVPFSYLRLRKELVSSYPAIRPKRTGNRNFCAGGCTRAVGPSGADPFPRPSCCASPSLSVSVKRPSRQLGKGSARFTDTDKEREGEGAGFLGKCYCVGRV